MWQTQQYARWNVRKKPLLLNAASVPSGSVPPSSFCCHPFSTKVKVCWKLVVCLDKKFFADLQKTWSGCSVRAFRTFRHALRTIAGLSINRECDARTHFWKKHNYREWIIGVSVFEDESWCWVELSSAPITRRGDFLWWILCQMFADNASVYSCSI